MSLVSSSNERIMAEPLLVCTDHHSCSQHDKGRDRSFHTSRCQRLARWSYPSSSPESLKKFSLHFRPKFVLAGFLFGVLMELVYVQTMTWLGLATRTTVVEPTSTTTTTATTTHDNYSVRTETWSDLFTYEIVSFLYADAAMFLLYMMALSFYSMKKNITVSLPIMAANWTVGMVLGLSAVAASLVGPKVGLQQQLWQILGSVALYFIVFAAVVEMQTSMGLRPSPLVPCSAVSCCGAEEEAAEHEETQCDDHVGNGPRTMSLIEAHIV